VRRVSDFCLGQFHDDVAVLAIRRRLTRPAARKKG